MAAAPFEELRSQAEELQRQGSPNKWHIAEIVAIVPTGIFFLLHAVLSFNQTKSDRIAAWVLAACAFLVCGAIIWRILYLRRKMKRILAEMHSSLDLESAGELRK